MATILLAAAGAAVGSAAGGAALGLSGAVIGRAVGATLGRVIDQRLLGAGSDPVEVGRVDRFRIMGASEGTAIPICWGANRLPAQVIWASPYTEIKTTSGGGKGSPKPATTRFSYVVSLALALCEGEILGIGKVWADGEIVNTALWDLRVYPGSETQLPDPAIEVHEGSGNAPAYRGTAYVVIENLALDAFGNRVPQFSFEVFRRANLPGELDYVDYQSAISAVALIPGTGEYALSSQRARVDDGFATSRTLNVSSQSGQTDFEVSMDQLRRELPNCSAVSLVICWFGDDLRCAECQVRPKVESSADEATGLPWKSGGIARAEAIELSKIDGRPIYGGTPSDQSIIEAIRALNSDGKAVMFYPFVLMEQTSGNSLPNPYDEGAGQPSFPWRGRITLSIAPGRIGSPDLSEQAENEVAAFFGASAVSDFSIVEDQVLYSGDPNDWGYRRFILHYAHLCKAAGGVEAFCVGSELRGLTTIRGRDHSFPTVAELIALAQDVRAILGPDVKISYAADWSEYFGYRVDDNVYFHLDPFWSHEVIDFIGVDNYLPVSDWRDGKDHADADWGAIYNLDYLKANIGGGEGFDWFYVNQEAREAQLRTIIEDTAYGEHWVFRPKDFRSWWSNLHHERIEGVRNDLPTSWVPEAKPIRFTEYGCPAADKGTNTPNRFFDPKSSESALPHFSNGNEDACIQMQYFRAQAEYWGTQENNPVSSRYNSQMLDLSRSYAWAWDIRPFPEFPGNTDKWADGVNHKLGHWLNGRVSGQPLDGVIKEICLRSGGALPMTAQAYGFVRGFLSQDTETARAILQPLSLAFGFDSVEADGFLSFATRGTQTEVPLSIDVCVVDENGRSSLQLSKAPEVEIPNCVRLIYLSADGSFDVRVAEAKSETFSKQLISQVDLSLALTDEEAFSLVSRWLAESRSSRDSISARLPPSITNVHPGGVITLSGADYRVDRLELDDARFVEAVRIEQSHYTPLRPVADQKRYQPRNAWGPVTPLWLDLPSVTGEELVGVASTDVV